MVETLVRQTEITHLPYAQETVNSLNLSDSFSALLASFLNSDLATNLASKTTRALASKPRNLDEFYEKVAGRFFEDLTYYYLAQKYKGKYTLTSPTETHQIYDTLYFLRSFERYSGFEKGLHGISVPDGLLLQNSRRRIQVRGLFEYKAGNNPDNNQYYQIMFFSNHELISDNLRLDTLEQSQNLGRIISDIRPELPHKSVQIHPKCNFSYAVPENSSLFLPNVKNRIKIPLHSTQLGDVTNAFLCDCQSNLAL